MSESIEIKEYDILALNLKKCIDITATLNVTRRNEMK